MSTSDAASSTPVVVVATGPNEDVASKVRDVAQAWETLVEEQNKQIQRLQELVEATTTDAAGQHSASGKRKKSSSRSGPGKKGAKTSESTVTVSVVAKQGGNDAVEEAYRVPTRHRLAYFRSAPGRRCRLSADKHLPQWGTNPRRRCVVCHCRTHTLCSFCKVPVCHSSKGCFFKFHTSEEI